jgi:hypothetical protein
VVSNVHASGNALEPDDAALEADAAALDALPLDDAVAALLLEVPQAATTAMMPTATANRVARMCTPVQTRLVSFLIVEAFVDLVN